MDDVMYGVMLSAKIDIGRKRTACECIEEVEMHHSYDLQTNFEITLSTPGTGS